MNDRKKTGILLLNLGGPEKIDDVEPFLYNLFSDRQIIRLGPGFMQKPLARMIAWRRAPKSAASYKLIGGGSPIRRITDQQARALQLFMAGRGDFIVRSCMRYWHPFSDEAVRDLINEGVNQIIALPLYPHYSIATTGSSMTDLKKTIRNHPGMSLIEIGGWPEQPSYIQCLAKRIHEGISLFQGDQPRIVYSAHSLPKKFIDEGDPYVDDIKKTIQAVERLTGHKGHLCYQSRSGPVEWLEPSTPEMLEKLASEGCKNILMVPISFVSDHVETLYEIDMLYRDMARDMGMRLESTKGLNDDPDFIQALATLVLDALCEHGEKTY